MASRDLLAAKPTGKIRADLTSATIATNAWTVISASVPASCTAIMVAYTGKGILRIAKGDPGSEVELPLFLTPGMSMEELIPLELTKAWKLSAKCEDVAVAAGELVINLFG